MSFDEKMYEGKFIYSQDNKHYSEETFTVYREDKPQGNYTFSSDILSRVKTGEFLKIHVEYEMTNKFLPTNVQIKRSLGKKKSTERYMFSHKDKEIYYSFNGPTGFHEHTAFVNGHFHIATPAFVTSMTMTQGKKVDPVHRTTYTVLSTNNIWQYEGPFSETHVHIELMSLKPVEVDINGVGLLSTYCQMFTTDEQSTVHEVGTEFYLSKHLGIPYKALFENDISVMVDKFKNLQSNYGKLF